MEFGFERMGAIDFQKGCFVGQEVASRTHRKGTLRKKLWPLQFQQQAPAEGSRIVTAEQRPCGEIVTASGSQAIALIREDALGEELLCEGAAFQRLDGLFS
jgi:folate-binding Fe-S cluster repair protein YgfZ